MTYEEFVKLYNEQKISVAEIKKRLGQAKYTRYRKKAIQKGDIKQRPFNLRFRDSLFEPKFYHFDKQQQKYRVHKVIKGKYHSYGFYETEKEAQQIVEKLKKHNWNKEVI
jgi:hypothetical protein